MRIISLIALTLVAAAGTARAQAELVPADADKAADAKKDIDGWNPYLGLTSTVNMTDNDNVIGQVNGLNTLFGLGVLGGADYVQGPHLFRTTLTINEGFARTPVVSHFVKSNDVAKLDTIYNYFATKYFGAYARASAATSLFASEDVRGAPSSWVDVTGATPVPLDTNTTSQHLADPFAPFTITESVGGFADPVRRDDFTLSVRLGIGGRHTFADGVLVNHDDSTTPAIEMLRLSSVEQLGAEAFAGAVGKLDKGKANYKAGVALLLPFVNNDKYDRSFETLTRIAIEGNLTYNMNSWLSLVYSVAVTRDPQLFPDHKDEVQVQNTLLLTFQMNLVKKKEKPKEKTKEELEIAAQKKRADDAEKRATDLQEQVKKLQLQLTPPEPPPTPPTPPTPPPDAPAPVPAPGP
jgi:hypothetical protein